MRERERENWGMRRFGYDKIKFPSKWRCEIGSQVCKSTVQGKGQNRICKLGSLWNKDAQIHEFR